MASRDLSIRLSLTNAEAVKSALVELSERGQDMLAEALKRGSVTTDEHGKFLKLLKDRCNEASGAVTTMGNAHGLATWQIQAVSHSVRASAEMLMAGASPVRTFAMEGMRLTSVFGAGSLAIMGWGAAVAALAAPVALGLAQLMKMEDESRRLSVALKAMGDSARLSVGDLKSVITQSTQTGPFGHDDAFVKWATTGKLSADDLFNTIAEDAVRAAYRMAIVAPLFGAAGAGSGLFGGMIGSLGGLFSKGGSSAGGSVPVSDTGNFAIAHSGGLVGIDSLESRTYSASVFTGAPKYHSGGLVAGEQPIIAKVGEGVFTPRQMDNADRLLGAALSRPSGPSVEVNVHNSASKAEARAQWSQGADGRVQIDVFVEEVESRLNRRIGRGEGMAPVLEHRYGLNPAAGAYR